ncbi:MAG: trigger factor, partial [Bacilli bacterium]|nr:trigger factor [Bacilli bacterium]
MANTKKEAKTNIHEIVIKIEGSEWTKALDNAFTKEQKKVSVDGFRKGKVPRNIYEKKYGKESLFMPAAEEVLQKAYEKAMTESDLIPVVQPSVDIKDITENGVEFLFKIITKPEVKVKKYKGLNVKPEEVKVTKEEIEHRIGHLLEEYTELVTKEGKVVNGDVAVIDFEGFKDGVAFDGGKGENYSLEIGSNTFIPGFEDQIIGMKTGDEKEISVSFPEDYGVEDLKGQPVIFKVKVNEIKEKVTRELDKEFFEDLAMEGVDSKETLEKQIESEIKAQKEMENENKYIDTLLEEVAKNVEVDIPQEMVDEET